MKEQATKAEQKKVMNAALAGSWYSADAAELRTELAGYLENAGEPQLAGHVSALVMPHAGYAFSGQAGAYAMREIAGKSYKRVVVLGLTHRVRLPNRASVAKASHYRTPLGEIPLDQAWTAKLLADPLFDFIPQAHDGENSIELQIPFLQVALGSFDLVMIAVGQLDAPTTERVARTLLELLDDETLLVVSGDFTHYGPRFDYVPFRSDIRENLKILDMGAFDFMRAGDLPGWMGYIERTGATICGTCSFGTLIAMLSEQNEVHLLHYTTSGELTGDWNNSVSYVAAAVTGPWRKNQAPTVSEQEPAPSASAFTDDEKRALLTLARASLEHRMRSKPMPAPAELGVKITPLMRKHMGTFVTLNKNGNLRGCIGEILPRRPLYEAVMDRVLRSAFEDPRFPPVQAAELPDIEIEISALSPPRPVNSHEEIVIGRHGVILQKGMAGAVFLPQVAPEQGWDLPTTLSHLAMKAGLAPQAWREGCRFEVFEATVFHEKDFQRP